MSHKIPYIASPASIPKILNKIKEAKSPDRFNDDFLQSKLGFKGGTNRQFIPLAKKCGLLKSDGSPTELYKKFRNDSTSKIAIAEAIKIGFKDVFERNEYANNLKKEEFKGLIVEITGLEPTNRVVQLICQTFESLNKLADFEGTDAKIEIESNEEEDPKEDYLEKNDIAFKLGIGYTINLILPKTDDPAVFNAIFKSLRENLLRK